jgi:5-methylcytosine-specific restriction enzyme subunit McrC
MQPDSLLDVLAQALIGALAEIEINGLFRQYVEHLEDTSFPRGRILLNQTMIRHEARGIGYRVTAAWFESSFDNAPNRCLKYAIWSLAQRYSSIRLDSARRGILAELNRVHHLFSSVALDGARQFLSDALVAEPARIPSIRAYYRDPVYLARAIAQNQGVALAGPRGAILMATLLLSLQDIFEAYLREVLKSSFRTLDPTLEVLNGNKAGAGGGKKLLFDGQPSDAATPDIVMRAIARDGSSAVYPVIVDAKYKKITSRPYRDDINQLIAYGASYRAPKVVLVHPRAESARHGLSLLGRIGSLAVYEYALDLAAGDLPEEERVLSESMFRLARGPAQDEGPAPAA